MQEAYKVLEVIDKIILEEMRSVTKVVTFWNINHSIHQQLHLPIHQLIRLEMQTKILEV